jgi:hypothetical protein
LVVNRWTLPPLLLMCIISTGGCVRAGFNAAGGDGPLSWTPFSAPQKIPNVNAASHIDWAPCLASDGLTLYFASDRPGGAGDFDLWAARRATVNDLFNAPFNLTAFNTDGGESEPSTSGDELELYFYRAGEGILRADRSTLAGAFSAPAVVVAGLLPPGKQSVGGPFLAADGVTLYYHACTKEERSCDLAVAVRPAPGAPFSNVRLLDEVNSPGEDDGWPTVSANQLELYFEATRAPFGTRIFVATRASVSDPFGPVSVVEELALADGSGDPKLSRDGRTMVLAVETSGVWDLCVATRGHRP